MELREENDLAYISFNRNPRNTLTTSCFDQLSQMFLQLSKRPSRPLAIILESKAEDVFSFGADPKFYNQLNLMQKKELFVSLMNFCKAALLSRIPLIVDLNGPAMAGGAILASLSDFAIANQKHGKLGFSEVKVGIPIPYCLFRIAERRISREHFSNMMLIGRSYDAKRLKEMEFVTDLYTSEDSRVNILGDLISRIKRIDKDVMAYTIKNRNKHLVPETDTYLHEFDKNFLVFLSSDQTSQHFQELEKL